MTDINVENGIPGTGVSSRKDSFLTLESFFLPQKKKIDFIGIILNIYSLIIILINHCGNTK